MQILQIVASDLGASKPAKQPLNIIDLPFDMLWKIFSKLELRDAISVAKTHPTNLYVVCFIYNRKIINQTVEITIPFNTISISSFELVHEDKRPQGFQLILDFLKYFGHFLINLKVNEFKYLFNVETALPQHEILQRQISKYVTEQLKALEFDFHQLSYYPLFGLEGPFPNVEKVQLRDGTCRTRLNLSEIFPVVRNLNVDTMVIVSEDLMQNFPYLERLTIPEHWGEHRANFPSFEQTLEINPQLKHLTIPKCKWDALQVLNKIRPDLESLELSSLVFHDIEDVIIPLRFENMKVFKCFGPPFGMLGGNFKKIPLEFGNLEEIQIYRKDFSKHWLKIIMENRKLKKLTAKNKLELDQLLQIANGLPNLEEFIMEHTTGNPVSIYDIAEFIKNANRLKRASFTGFTRNQCEEVTQRLNNQWDILEKNWSYCRLFLKGSNEFFH